MLDSLVRVSRRVGWETDRFATDPEDDGGERGTSTTAVSKHCEQSLQVERQPRSPRLRHGGWIPRSPGRPTPPGTITLPPKGELPFPGAYDGQRTGRGALPAESALASGHTDAGRAERLRTYAGRPIRKMNSAGRLCGPIRLPLYGFTYS